MAYAIMGGLAAVSVMAAVIWAYAKRVPSSPKEENRGKWVFMALAIVFAAIGAFSYATNFIGDDTPRIIASNITFFENAVLALGALILWKQWK